METTLKSRVLHAYKTEQEWTSADPVLKVGEMAFSSDKYGYYKLGNGTSKWSQLGYVIASANDFTDADSAKLNELNTYYGTCSVAQGTAAKTVSSVTGVNSKFTLTTGATIRVKFSNANTAASPTLDVCGTGAKYIKKYGTTASMAYMWQAGEIVEFVYDGTNYVMTKGGLGTTTYYGLVKLSSSTSSTATDVAATPSAVKDAYDLANTANNGLDDKVDKVDGMDLSSNDFTDALLTKLNGIDEGANKYILPVAGTALGGVKSGTDITVDSNGNVSVKDDSHNHIISNVDGLQDALDGKVDTEEGKGLSTNDFTNTLLTKLNGIAEGANKYTLPVAGTSIGGVKSGTDITVDSSGNVSVKDDSHNHIISNVDGLQDALDGKVDTEDGKGLSSNDFTGTLKSKLEGIAEGAEVNQNAFTTVKVGSTSLSADSKTDTLTITAGDNITLTPTESSDSFKISATDTKYTPASATPKAVGTAAVGTSDKYAREDHVHNISLASGDSNGQVKVAGTNIDVKGLKSAAYTESSDYATSGHDHDATYLKTGAIGTAIPSSSDLNTYKTPGTYYAADSNVTKTLTNCPFTGSGFTLFVIRGYSTSRVCQVIVDNQNNVYRRYYNASSWTAWGKDYNSANKPTKSDLGLGNVENKSSATIRGEITKSNVTTALGYTPAELDSNGLVLTSQLPSYVDDVVEGYLNNSKFYKESAHTTEITGEASKIYVDLSTNKTYRWSGSAFTEISASLALGETSSTAYRGDRGKTAYDHSQKTSGNPHKVTKADVGLGNVDNTSDADKPISTATQTALDATHNASNITEGVLPAQRGGTGKTTLKDAANDLINALDTGSSTPVDADYYISQYVKGGTTTTTYHRRPMSALWSYIKGKTDAQYLKLSGGTLTGDLKLGTSTQSTLPSAGITIHDIRSVEDTPAWGDKTANFYFTQSRSPDTTKWWSVFRMRGWTGGYSDWEIAGPANNTDQSSQALYVRTSNTNTAWGSWRKIYDTSNKPTASDVGALSTSGGEVTGTLVLSKDTDASGTANNSPALIVGGKATAAHIEIDANEIQAKSNGTTATALNINIDGGTIFMGSIGAVNNIRGDTTFITKTPLLVDLTNNGNATNGTIYNVLGARYKNSAGVTETTYPVRYIGEGDSNGYNPSILLGSTSGTTVIGAGESSGTMPAKISAYNDESIYLIADGVIHGYVGCANDASSYTKAFEVGSTATNVYNDLLVDGRLKHKGTYVHIANASGDSAAYVKVLQIKVIANYPNRPIHLMVARRSKRITNLSICFNNNNNTDPTLQFFEYDNGNDAEYYLYKSATSTWDLYAKQAEQYDIVYIFQLSYALNMYSVSFLNEYAASLPSGYVSPTARAINGNLNGTSTTANGLIYTTARPTSADPDTIGGGVLRHFLASSSMTTNKPPTDDGVIIHLPWDGTNGFDAQIAVKNTTGQLAVRGMKSKTWQSWIKILDETNYSSYALPLTGGTLSGDLYVSRAQEANVLVDYTGENAHKGSLTVTVGGTFGLYDRTKSKWVVYSDKDGNVNLNGNASTATKLASAVKIDGISFDGSADIVHYGTCSTGASTKAKVVTCAGFSLETGARIYVKFTNAQTYNGQVTLNVNSTGAKNVCQKGTVASVRYEWQAGEVIAFIYDGTNWLIENGAPATTTYYGRTKLSSSLASTATTLAATPSTVNALRSIVNDLPVYSASATYEVGDRVIYNTDAFECNTAITTAEAWTAAHWTQLSPLQTQIDNVVNGTTGGTFTGTFNGQIYTEEDHSQESFSGVIPTFLEQSYQSGYKTVRHTWGLVYHFRDGKDSTYKGYSILQLGNEIDNSTANGTQGYLRMYGPGTKFGQLQMKDTPSDNITITLPTIAGELMSCQGTQTITGQKTFSGNNTFTGQNFIKNTTWIVEGNVTKGTNPSVNCYKEILVLDKSSETAWNTTTHKRLAGLGFLTQTNGNTSAYIEAYINSTTSGAGAVLSVVYDKANNVTYATAPTYTGLTDNSTKIVTTAYLRNIFRTGTAAATASNCPNGCFYFQYS